MRSRNPLPLRSHAGSPARRWSPIGYQKSSTVPDPVRVPLFATRTAIDPLLPRIAERMREVLDSGRYILGPEVEAWEAEFGAYIGTDHCIGVANGTDALTIGLRALGVAPGDEVVVPGRHVLCDRRGGRQRGCVPDLRGCRAGHVVHDCEHRGAGID